MGSSCTKINKNKRDSTKSDTCEALSNRRISVAKKNMIRIKNKDMHDEYKITDEIKNSKYSIVCKCKSKNTGKKYLAKFFKISKIDSKALSYFLREIELLRNIDHPNIVKIIDIYKNSKNAIIIMEDCKGGDFLDKIKMHKD